MNKAIKVTAALCCLFFCAAVFAQPAKVKPASKTAAQVKKIDYAKLKTEIRSLYRAEKHKEAIAKATQYLLKFPKDTQVTFQKAISHVSLKQYQVGFNLIKKFYSNPDTAAKYIAFMGFSVPENDILTSGIICADEAIKTMPTAPYGYFIKAGVYSDRGDHEKALPIMQQMNAATRDDNEKMMFGHFYAKELAFTKQHAKALMVINDLYVKYPKNTEIINSYAVIYRLNESYDKAVEKYDELIQLYPDDPDYQSQKINTLAMGGKITEACAAAELLIAKDDSYEFMRFRYKCAAYFAVPAITTIKTATWAVNSNGSDYDFTVSNLKGNTNSDFEFDWLMTSGTDMNGHIKLTQAAMEKAVAQNNYFGASLKNATLTDKTTVWVSKAVINDLIKNNKCKMDVGNGEEEFTVLPDIQNDRDPDSFDDKVMVNGKEKFLNTLHVQNADGSRQLWILNDINNPLIVKMDIGFKIILKSIE